MHRAWVSTRKWVSGPEPKLEPQPIQQKSNSSIYNLFFRQRVFPTIIQVKIPYGLIWLIWRQVEFYVWLMSKEVQTILEKSFSISQYIKIAHPQIQLMYISGYLSKVKIEICEGYIIYKLKTIQVFGKVYLMLTRLKNITGRNSFWSKKHNELYFIDIFISLWSIYTTNH